MSIHSLRKRFIKDQKLPIPVLQSPYFEYFLELYEEFHQSKSKYDVYLKEVEEMGGEEPYLGNSHKLVAKITNHIEQKESYQKLNDSKNQLSEFTTVNRMGKENIYNGENIDRKFISIDLKKANFHVLRLFDADIVDNAKTYEEWIASFTNSPHIQSSKYLRQVIFGNLNPKRQIKMQQFYIDQLATVIKHASQIMFDRIKTASSDEIVMEWIDDETTKLVIRSVMEKAVELDIPINIHLFELKGVTQGEELLGYAKKTIGEDKVEFKAIPDLFMAQAFKAYFNLPLQEEDFVFYHEGRLAKFL